MCEHVLSPMFIPLSRLLIRLRQPKSRADDHAALVARMRTAMAAEPGDGERAAAAELRVLRTRMAALTSGVVSCAGCAAGKPWPEGAFAGGHCCSGATTDVWTDDEIAALVAAGTRPGDLDLPAGEHAGCAFRGPVGCSLEPVDRPSKCLRFMCRQLSREVFERGQTPAAVALVDQLDDAVLRFSRLLEARREREWMAELDAQLAAQRNS